MTTPASQPATETPAGFRLVEISREPIELFKILKFEGMATSGGHAKMAVASGEVLVNGQSEVQKRKKIVTGDTIEFNGDRIFIRLSSSEGPHSAHPALDGDPDATDSDKTDSDKTDPHKGSSAAAGGLETE